MLAIVRAEPAFRHRTRPHPDRCRFGKSVSSRRARETNPQSGDFLLLNVSFLIRDAIHRGEDRIARVLMHSFSSVPRQSRAHRAGQADARCRIRPARNS